MTSPPARETQFEPAAGVIETFTFQAQSDDGKRLSGVIEAGDADAAIARLEALRLRVIDVARVAGRGVVATGTAAASSVETEPAGKAGDNGKPRPGRALRGDDFAAFNQQFAQLTRAGLPVEHGLRLIAGDMRRGRLARTIEQVAEELERGTPLGEAFDKHRGRFPTLYGRLIDAGVRAGDLPGVLLGLGRHIEMVQRLRGTLWRTISYPLMVFIGLCLVLVFLGIYVLPQFEQIYAGLYETRRQMLYRALTWRPAGPPPDSTLPWVTKWLIALGTFAPLMLLLMIALFIGVPLGWGLLRLRGWDRAAADRLLLPMPLVGPVLRLNLIARWCDALRLGVSAGLDLPAALELAGDVTGSPALKRDGAELTALLEHGKPLSTKLQGRRMLPATVPAAIDLASGHHDLPRTLETLSEMYERQAESRLASLPAVLTPLLVIFVAAATGFVIAGLLLPMIRAIESYM